MWIWNAFIVNQEKYKLKVKNDGSADRSTIAQWHAMFSVPYGAHRMCETPWFKCLNS